MKNLLKLVWKKINKFFLENFILPRVYFSIDFINYLHYVCKMIEFKKNLTCGCRGVGIGDVKKWILNDFYYEKVYLLKLNRKYFISKEKPLKFERAWLYEHGRFEELHG